MPRLDPHSYADSDHPDVISVDWRARVDFASRTIEAEARLELARPAQGPLHLDTRDLTIESVRTDEGNELAFALAPADPILGARLTVELPSSTSAIRVRYRTSPTASALQWLTPAQTAGGQHPYLFSQCQAIHARSVLPCQDTPRVRIRYTAEVTIPVELRSLLAAASVSRQERGAIAVERWRMPQPIPPYLFAFAVGNLASRELGPRSRVWSEPEVVERAAWEFAGVDAMLLTAESLLGPYEWERFDVLCMPPSFPYGGMENPRLTFVTPSLLAGDRSLVNVVAHELAHSWTGNLVSNANAEHFWLNEGFTVFAERRIQEATDGVEGASLHAAVGRRELDRAIARFVDRPELTRLRTHLDGIDPDEAFSEIPYEKGYLFLRALEDQVGRDAFDRFLKRYIATFRFQSITTDDFLALVDKELPGALAAVDAPAWIDGPGVPPRAPAPRSARLDAIRRLDGALPEEAVARAWGPTEWQLYLESVTRPALASLLDTLEARHHLLASENYEVLVAWLELATDSGRAEVLPRLEQVLGKIGRMKYLRRLYRVLARRAETRELARRWFATHRASYHPIAQQVIAAMLEEKTG